MRLIFCGSRYWENFVKIMDVMGILHDFFPDLCVIEGEADGADKYAKWAAQNLGIPFIPVKADWDTYRRAAGPLRNDEMLMKYKANGTVAFHDDIRSSRGTLDMVTRTLKVKRPVLLVTSNPLSSLSLKEFTDILRRSQWTNRSNLGQ